MSEFFLGLGFLLKAYKSSHVLENLACQGRELFLEQGEKRSSLEQTPYLKSGA